jgi:hypothetical protein
VGDVFSEAKVLVVGAFGFTTPGRSIPWALNLEGKARGKALIHVLWFAGSGEELGRAQIEVRVR